MAKVICTPCRKPKFPSFLDNKVIVIDIDELDEDPCIRKKQITRLVEDVYKQANKDFQSSADYGNKVKNGKYRRKFYISDPLLGIRITFEIQMQRYLDKDEGRTNTFYGGIFMPRFRFMLGQALLILSEKAAYEVDPIGEFGNDKFDVHQHCKTWSIPVRTYYRSFSKIAEALQAKKEATLNEIKNFLASLYYAVDIEEKLRQWETSCI